MLKEDLEQESAHFPVKDKTVNILDFVAHITSVITTKPWHCGVKEAMDKTEINMAVPIKLDL
jgi:hypothetical protein